MANLELHNPEDTCSFVNAAEYNAYLGPVVGVAYEPLTEDEFQQLRSGASCPVPLMAAEMPEPMGLVEVGTEAMSTPTGRGPEVSPAASVAGRTQPPAKAVPQPFQPGGLVPYPGWATPIPRADHQSLKVVLGAAGILATILFGWLVRRGQ